MHATETVRRRWQWRLLTTVLVGAVIAGCTSQSSTPTAPAATETAAPTAAPTAAASPSQSGVAEAKAIVTALEASAQFTFDGPAITNIASLKGKRIYAIGNGLAYFFVKNWLSGVTEAAKLLGMEVTAVDASTNDPAGLIEQGVSQGYDVILLQSVDSASVAAPLADAKAAKIPVIELTTSDPQLPSAAATSRGVFGYVTFCYTCAGKQMAAFVVANGGDKASAAIYNVPGLVVSEAMVKAFKDELARLCPACTVSVIDAPFAQWTNLQSLTGTAIESNKGSSPLYLVPVFDSMVSSGVAAAVAEKGASLAKIVTYNGTDAGLSAVADGSVAADLGGPQVWLGWATVDQIARALTGAQPVEDEKLPARIFWSGNIKSIDLTKSEATWYGGADFRAGYKTIWGIQ
ncbi:MAG: substrate-binding domain-containing protein [Candidatus Limnocylindrales bacterium]|jgi:ribose transport system substrate-binding protein